MANERLRAALVKAGLELEDLADRVDVDAKTVQRWLGGRTPHARHRAKVTHVLDCSEEALWPELALASRPPDDRSELAGIFASSNDLRVPDWRPLLQEAREKIDLLDYSLTDVITAPGVIELLATKSAAGCQVRVLIAHPKSIWVTSLAQQLGLDDPDADGNTLLDRQISQSRSHLERLIDKDGIELRTFWAERTNSILRFDDQMLVTLHLYAAPEPHAPLIHLAAPMTTGYSTGSPIISTRSSKTPASRSRRTGLYPPPGAGPVSDTSISGRAERAAERITS